jgi:hypothetical protein
VPIIKYTLLLEDADDDDDDDDHAAATHERPRTRKELDQVKGKFANKILLASHYHQDPLLPLEFKAMFWAAHSVLKEYEETLEAHRNGQDMMGDVHTDWNLGTFLSGPLMNAPT